MLSQLDGDIDKNAMSIIELKLANSRALERKPGLWRETWNVEYFLKALEEVFAKEEGGQVLGAGRSVASSDDNAPVLRQGGA